jgi:hypothetical protein
MGWWQYWYSQIYNYLLKYSLIHKKKKTIWFQIKPFLSYCTFKISWCIPKRNVHRKLYRCYVSRLKKAFDMINPQALVVRTTPLFSNFLFTNLFSLKFLYFFIISSLFSYFNLFVSIFIQSYVNIKWHIDTNNMDYSVVSI